MGQLECRTAGRDGPDPNQERLPRGDRDAQTRSAAEAGIAIAGEDRERPGGSAIERGISLIDDEIGIEQRRRRGTSPEIELSIRRRGQGEPHVFRERAHHPHRAGEWLRAERRTGRGHGHRQRSSRGQNERRGNGTVITSLRSNRGDQRESDEKSETKRRGARTKIHREHSPLGDRRCEPIAELSKPEFSPIYLRRNRSQMPWRSPRFDRAP